MTRLIKTTGKPSIRDVAEAAGVSRAAVSLVLNDGPIRISEAKRKRIIEIARDMKYTPHLGARRLAIQRTETLGLVMPSLADGLSDYDLFALTQHAALAASEYNYDVLIHFYDHAEPPADTPAPGRTDGSIVVLGQKNGPAYASLWERSAQPHVIIGGGFFSRKPADFVDVDLSSGAAAATSHMIELGHRDIAFVTGPGHRDKLSGYLVALARSHIPVRREWILEVGFTETAWRQAAQAIAEMQPRPTALVFANDAVAIRMMRMLQDLGLRIPDDLSISGYDNLETTSLISPRLTTVRVPTQKMALLAVNQLIAMVENRPHVKLQALLSAELIVRESTAACKR